MSNPDPGRLTEHLLAENLISPDQLEVVLHRASVESERIEDALIDSGVMSETDLLKFLARLYHTRFVATAKLSRAEVDRNLLEALPKRLAEQHQVFPVFFDAAAGSLSVVSPDAGDARLPEVLQSATKVREVRVYVARPAAVKAAIQKHYAGDLYAFAQVDNQGREQYLSLLDLYDRNTVGVGGATTTTATGATMLERRERVISEKDLSTRTAPLAMTSGAAKTSLLEAVTVLVSLLENGRGDLRGHSAFVARWIRKLAERIRLPAEETHALVMAGLLHDVGKASVYHLTALNAAVFENHRTAAQKSYLTPVKLFEAVPLDATTISTLQSMYECFDGNGFPDGLSGKDIPLGGRMLSVIDTYADLTQNPNNPYRRVLTASEACDVLDQNKGTVFDRNIVDLLRQTVTGDDLRARLLSERTVVMLIDPDPEESTVLELRMVEEGFEVLAARTTEEAHAVLAGGTAEVCVSETEIDGQTGFDLLQRARSGGPGSGLPWIFLTRDSRRESVARGFELGAADYVLKPASPEVLIAKIRQLIAQRSARAARGVAGSLSELGLTDVVQVLAQGRKTGQLKIVNGPEHGEVHFAEGQIVNAMWLLLRGEEAFFGMLGLSSGEFSFDPTFKPGPRVINGHVDALMLEGLRRLDESRAAAT